MIILIYISLKNLIYFLIQLHFSEDNYITCICKKYDGQCL